nr:MAG TPA: chaperone protein [Bacteriophage sp.]
MGKEVRRPPRVAVCKECHGTGVQQGSCSMLARCPQCEGSGRVTVSSVTTLDIRPYRPKQTHGPVKIM